MYMYNELYLKVNIQTYFYQNVWHIGYKILIYLKWVLDWNMVIVFSILNFVIDVNLEMNKMLALQLRFIEVSV